MDKIARKQLRHSKCKLSHQGVNKKKSRMINSSRGVREGIASFRIFFHPDCTVGFGIAPKHTLRLVGFTTGRELHPALKTCHVFIIANAVSHVKHERKIPVIFD